MNMVNNWRWVHMVFLLDFFFRKCDACYCEEVIVNMAKNCWWNWRRTGVEYGKELVMNMVMNWWWKWQITGDEYSEELVMNVVINWGWVNIVFLSDFFCRKSYASYCKALIWRRTVGGTVEELTMNMVNSSKVSEYGVSFRSFLQEIRWNILWSNDRENGKEFVVELAKNWWWIW